MLEHYLIEKTQHDLEQNIRFIENESESEFYKKYIKLNWGFCKSSN